MNHIILDNSSLSSVKIFKYCLSGCSNDLHKVLSEMNIDVTSLDNLPQDICILLAGKDDPKGRSELNLSLDSLVPPCLLCKIHDLLRGTRTIDETVG